MREERSGSRLIWVLLAFVLVISAASRLYDVKWDGGIMAHPDERSTVAFYAPTIGWPASLDEALDPHRSPLNPFWDVFAGHRRSYTYGHFPLYVLVLIGNLLHALAPGLAQLGAPTELVDFLAEANTVSGFLVIGRVLTALFDVGSVALAFLIARQLYGAWAGLLAASLSTFTVLQIQLAHFFAVDPISATFVLLALYGAMLMAERNSNGHALLTGIAVGLAVASKFSALPIIAAPFVATLAALLVPKTGGDDKAARQLRAVLNLALTYVAAFVAFAVTSPYVFLDFNAFLVAVVHEQGAMVRGVADMPFTRQYRGTLPYMYFIEQQVRWGMGWALGLAGFAGAGWAIFRALFRRVRVGEIILLSWLIPYFGFTGLFLAKFMRYMSPVVPLLIIFGSGMLVSLYRWGTRSALLADDAVSISRPPSWSGVRSVARVLSLGLALLTLAATAFWAAAFVNGVYSGEHTWVQASRWIYANIPDGSALGLEHWDDNLPFGLPEDGANIGVHRYRVVEFPMYEDDTQAKYELLKARVREVDYIILASNRLYRTIPRLPRRYPMSTRYYQALFSGALGFEKVAEFTNYPRLGPFVFNDDAADESFTVYDHPKPLIFKKVRDLSDVEWQQLFGRSWETAIPGFVGQKPLLARLWGDLDGLLSLLRTRDTSSSEERESPKKSLLLDQPVDTLPVVDDYRWNRWASHSTLGAVVCWWVVLQLLGWLGWPLTFVVFRNLADRGHLFSKSLTVLLLAYLVWLPSSFRLAQNKLAHILLVLGLITALSAWLVYRFRGEMLRFWREDWKLVAFNEILMLGAFLFFVGIRLLNPDLWQPWLGGEKFMDFAFLNATLKSAYFPPYDPYFAGGYLNYYYYGQFVVGLWIKLTGIMPTVAFNLIIPTLFALTIGNSFCLGYNLAAKGRPDNKLSALATGVTAAAFVAVVGNLEGFLQLWRQLGNVSGSTFHSTLPLVQDLVRGLVGIIKALQGYSLPTYNYWDPTRVIAYTINEFPFFSFLFADLHPHMINIPFALLFVALLFNVLRRAEPRSRGKSLWVWLPLPLVLGALAVINTWDFPTYWGLATLVFALKGYWRRGRFNWVGSLLFGLTLGGLSLFMYWPFFAHYQAIAVGLGLVDVKTDLGRFLAIWGMFLFLAAPFAYFTLAALRSRSGLARLASLALRKWAFVPRWLALYRSLVRETTFAYRLILFGVLALLVASAGLAAEGYWVIALLLWLLAPIVFLLTRRDADPAEQFALTLTSAALIVLIGCEIFYMKDFLGGGDWKRMNTLFKFYIQVWLLLGVACAAFLAWLMPLVDRWRTRTGRFLWNVAFVALLSATLVYPVLGTGIRVNDRFPGERPAIGTLDGMAFMTVGTYTWPDENNRIELKYDYEAIRWLMDHVTGTPVIAEANLPYYREGGLRVASMTGFPTLLGMHQSEQRYDWQVGRRDGLTRELYNTTDVSRTLELIEELHISYIYIGKLERTVYDRAGLNKFAEMSEMGLLELVFENQEVKIYEVTLSKT